MCSSLLQRDDGRHRNVGFEFVGFDIIHSSEVLGNVHVNENVQRHILTCKSGLIHLHIPPTARSTMLPNLWRYLRGLLFCLFAFIRFLPAAVDLDLITINLEETS